MNKFFRSTGARSLLCVAGVAGLVLLTAAGCPPVTPDLPDGTGDGDDAPTGAKLFTRIMQEDPYQEWAQFPNHQGVLSSALPHGPMSQVFINGTVEAALANFDGALPDGSIILKENIGTSPLVTEAALTVMWKVAGFDPDNNDWFWANMTPDGQIVAEGQVASCRACHGGARANDFVFTHQF